MSAKKLGRFTAGLFVALGLAFGGALAVTAGGDSTTAAVGDTAAVAPLTVQFEYDWV